MLIDSLDRPNLDSEGNYIYMSTIPLTQPQITALSSKESRLRAITARFDNWADAIRAGWV